MEIGTGRQADRDAHWQAILRVRWMAFAHETGLFEPASDRTRHATRLSRCSVMEDQTMTFAQKKAARAGPVIVFIDESGISEQAASRAPLGAQGPDPGVTVQLHLEAVVSGRGCQLLEYLLQAGTGRSTIT